MKRSWASHTLQLFLLIFSMLVPLKDAFQFSTKPPMENKKRYSSSLKMVASWKNGTTNRRTFVFQGAAGVFAGSLFSQNIAVFALDPTEKRKVLQSFAGQIKKFSESISEEPQLALLPAIRQSLDLKPLITLTSQYVETLGSFEVTETRKLMLQGNSELKFSRSRCKDLSKISGHWRLLWIQKVKNRQTLCSPKSPYFSFALMATSCVIRIIVVC
mmetsp:Transcript_95753/g.219487  ORF Transcript_95753/g.219487 Transcript_95753/m.219487 type:complete len:215 (-) Transcript_95753:516-1160(-)